jgi:nucleoside-diphosphate-sugar epimerase
MKGSILVTGASGFVGKHLVQALRDCGEQVVTHSGQDGDLAHNEPHASGIRHVFHLAARTYVPDSWTEPRAFYETNVLGTVNVLEFCRKSSCSMTLLSAYAYGRPKLLPTTEDQPLAALNPYSDTKIVAEHIAQFYQTWFRVPVTIVRPFNLYGPGQAEHFLVPKLIVQALDPDQVEVLVEDDRPRRDYIFVGDLVDLLVGVVDRTDGGTFNAGSGVSLSVREMAERIIKMAGTGKLLVSRGRERQGELADTVADITRARRELNWTPKVSLEEGLQLTIESVRAAARGTASGRRGS